MTISNNKSGDAASSKHILQYKEQLLRTDDYLEKEQIRLKDRVLTTYARLLDMFAAEKLQGKFLDTGAADKGFEKVCRIHDIECESIDIDMGVDFEKDGFPYDDRSFRYVNSNSVIEHLRNPGNYLREVYRVLEDDGFFILVTPHWPYAYKEFYDSFTHYQPYSYKSLNNLLAAYNFKTIASVPWLVNKSGLYWRIPAPLSFWVAKNLLFFPGTNRWAPPFLKGRSNSLLCLAQKKNI